MLENVTEFSVKIRYLAGEQRHDIFVPGIRKPVARMELMNAGHPEKKHNIGLLRVFAGPKLRDVVGYVRMNESALNAAGARIGMVSFAGGYPNGPVVGEFDQFGLGKLTRECIRKNPERSYEEMSRWAKIRAENGSHVARYSSADSAGFTVTARKGSRVHFTVHDDRVNRFLMLATYQKEQNDSLLFVVGLLLLAGVLRVFSGR